MAKTPTFETQYEDEIEQEFEARRNATREEYQWEKTAAQLPPDMPHTFRCCGTLYRFAHKTDRERGEIKHRELAHGGA